MPDLAEDGLRASRRGERLRRLELLRDGDAMAPWALAPGRLPRTLARGNLTLSRVPPKLTPGVCTRLIELFICRLLTFLNII